jgi:hypothetical protein
VLSGEATNTNFIIFGLTRLGFKPTQDKRGNHYTTDAVNSIWNDTSNEMFANCTLTVQFYIVSLKGSIKSNLLPVCQMIITHH